MATNQNMARGTGLICSFVLLVGTADAQQYVENSGDLLRSGDVNYGSNCVTGSKYYFAYLQRERAVGDDRRELINNRIRNCEKGYTTPAGNTAKYDSMNPGEIRCQSYAFLALTQQRVNLDAKCNNVGARWSEDFDSHFYWCMDVGDDTSLLRKEIDERRKAIDRCVFK